MSQTSGPRQPSPPCDQGRSPLVGQGLKIARPQECASSARAGGRVASFSREPLAAHRPPASSAHAAATAAALVDFDRDGQSNAFEYTAGLIPTDANSVFRLRLKTVPGQPGQKRVIFSPRLTDRTYTVKAKPSLLTGTFAPLGSSSFSDNAQERTVTDLSATGATKFYQVEIVKP
jgi:hypothetical protein